MRIQRLMIIYLILVTVGCVSAEFKPWTSNEVYQGDGGALKQIEG